MSIFGSIMEKIFHAPEATQTAEPSKMPDAGATTVSAPNPSATPTEVPPSATPAATVDVVDVLTKKASQKGGGGNWQTSIVDLLKLLDLEFQPDGAKGTGERTERPYRR